jgi:hypothetical protein
LAIAAINQQGYAVDCHSKAKEQAHDTRKTDLDLSDCKCRIEEHFFFGFWCVAPSVYHCFEGDAVNGL